MRFSCFFMCLCAILFLVACGQKGDLYLPDDSFTQLLEKQTKKPSEEAEKESAPVKEPVKNL